MQSEKFNKKEVEYGLGKRNAHCSLCIHYVPKRTKTEFNSCEIVSGVINPDDWCNKFEHK